MGGLISGGHYTGTPALAEPTEDIGADDKGPTLGLDLTQEE